ncbi:hypothetical protein M406DRAFT_356989 [Cryphonectria parasitica EP155]|uniref:Serine peptidase n=1 Tax=Cryphonectria parasitica (strain ATCC 38755 / EP155) TaxID=660469 RepID=A0A9P5CMH4_CRYP1|nr:uncharacterized protein M406DRAFT_356989 [Cryphonectria parasitica EP155]KAF3763262.1 hypothetical protein M406DRAFT_356989 [Cryphonectria parasitica EP155]
MKSVLLSPLLLAGSTLAALNRAPGPPKPLPPKRVDERFSTGSLKKRDNTTTVGQGTFEQLLDHNDPSKGTFSQRFWWSSEYWTGPGAPVVFFTPGEIEADEYTGYLTNETITGVFAQELGGAVVMMEHRYWGESSPYTWLTTENFTYLTLEQAIKDTTYLANNIDLPFDPTGSSLASNAPWVMAGGSYSGALTGWVEAVDPGTYWAYYATSAVVETIWDFYQYFKPVQAGMPANCSADVQSVIAYVDSVLTSNDTAAIQSLKAKFALEDLEHNDDFAAVLEYGPWEWQEIQFYSGYSPFYLFCDSVENVGYYFPDSTTVPGAEGVGLEKALDGYAAFIKNYIVDGACASYGYDVWTDEWDVGCFDTYNASSPFFTDRSVDNIYNLQWNWFLCNQPFAYWQDGAPGNVSTIVSRLVSGEYWQRQCSLLFPPPGTFDPDNKTVADTNAYTGGWDTAGNTTRLIWTNGQYDPWKDSTVSSDYKPGGPFQGTATAPIQVIPSGIHCSDMLIDNGLVNAGVQEVIDNEVAQIVTWVDEYYTEKKKPRVVRRH